MSYTYATLFLLALLLARALAPFVAGLALHLGAVDLPAARKVHRGVVPRLGGLAVVAGLLAPLVLLFFVDTDVALQFRAAQRSLFGLFLGLVLIIGLGVVDDVRGASAFTKFPVQIVAGLIAYLFGCRIGQISSPLGGMTWDLGFLAMPVTILWFVLITNAMNLIDGLDGLATGIIAFVAGTLFTLSNVNGHIAVAAVALALCGAAVGFLRYNFPPATIFLGDTGSLSAGYLIAGLSVLGAHKSPTAVALFVPIVVLGVPLFDTFTSFGRRLLRLRHPFQADAEHIHHRLLARGASQLRATLILYGVTGVLMVLALLVAYLDSQGSRRPMGWALFATAAFLLSVGGILGYLNVAEVRVHAVSGMRHRRLQRRRQRLLDGFRRRLASLGLPEGHPERISETEAWEAFVEQLELLEFEGYLLQVRELREVVPDGADLSAGELRFEKQAEADLTLDAVHARAILVCGRLRAQLTASRPGTSVARAHDVEALDEVIAVLATALEACEPGAVDGELLAAAALEDLSR